jgi:hypothetical protein
VITTLAPAKDTTFHAVRRRLSALLPDPTPLASAVPLELVSRGVQDAPTLRSAEVLEAGGMRAHAVSPPYIPRFAAFLDGAQRSLVVSWTGGVPIVHGTVAAVVRERRDRRMTTWSSPILRRALYAPLALLSPAAAEALRLQDLEIVDTLEKRKPESAHPFALQEIAYQSVLGAREQAEQELAKQWCATNADDLCIDGGISGSEPVARSTIVVGVIKSHQTLYAAAEDLPMIMALRVAERSSVVHVDVSSRVPVASWYLRLRDHDGRDPFWGLVRIEVALSGGAAALPERAETVSRWVLAEALPLSVPDARWDKMVYGIRDCEEYLRAIQ